MEIISASLSKNYDIAVGSTLNDFLFQFTNVFEPCKVLIVSDSTVSSLHLDTLKNTLASSQFTIYTYVVSDGELSKSLENTSNLLSYMAEMKFSHTDIVVALGGGMVGDLAGFAGSIYMRGICVVQIPTTLLAAVDSSVGGKTAVNLPSGKNLAGTFHQPSLVACIPQFLKTQGRTNLMNASGEIIKYSILSGAPNLDTLARFRDIINKSQIDDCDMQALTSIISTCIKIKLAFVCEDEYDKAGKRRLLNLGHTIAHAAEKLSNYSLPHGQAVGIGLSYVTRIAQNIGVCDKNDAKLILDILDTFEFPKFCESPEALADIILLDKKTSGDTVNFVLPKKFGLACVHPVKSEKLVDFLCQSK